MACIFFAPPPRADRPVFSLSPLQQLQTRTLLLRFLPAELVLEIMDTAAYHQVIVSSRAKRVRVVEGRETYLVSEAVSISRGARVEGWKVFVRGMEGGGGAFGLRTEKSSRSHSFCEAYLVRGEEEVLGSRRVLCENIRGFPKEITQVVKIERGTPGVKKEEKFPFVRMARGGDRLTVDVVADEEGWVNAVESVRIELSVSHFNPSTRLSSSHAEEGWDEQEIER